MSWVTSILRTDALGWRISIPPPPENVSFSFCFKRLTTNPSSLPINWTRIVNQSPLLSSGSWYGRRWYCRLRLNWCLLKSELKWYNTSGAQRNAFPSLVVLGRVRAGVSVAWGRSRWSLQCGYLERLTRSAWLAGQDAVHATPRNYYQVMNPLRSNSSASDPTSAVEISRLPQLTFTAIFRQDFRTGIQSLTAALAI
jgi:hypothetical protein